MKTYFFLLIAGLLMSMSLSAKLRNSGSTMTTTTSTSTDNCGCTPPVTTTPPPSNNYTGCVCPCPDCEDSADVLAAKALIKQGQDDLAAALGIRDLAEVKLLEIYNGHAANSSEGLQSAAGHLALAANYTSQSIDLIATGEASAKNTFSSLQSLLQQAISSQKTQFDFLETYSVNDDIKQYVQQLVLKLQGFEEELWQIICMVGTEHYNSQLFVKQAIINELALRDILVSLTESAVNGWPTQLSDLENLTSEEIATLIDIIQQLIANGEALNSELFTQAGLTSAEVCAVWDAINKIYSGFAQYTNAWRDCNDSAEIVDYQNLIKHVQDCAERVTAVTVQAPCPELPPFTPPVVSVPPPVKLPPVCPPCPVTVPPIDVPIPNPELDCPPYERCPPCPTPPPVSTPPPTNTCDCSA